MVGLMTGAGDYGTRLNTSMICLGTTPPPPPAITKGCIVTKLLYPLRYEGVVTKMVGENCFIMWTAFTNISNQFLGRWGQTGPGQKIERSSASREQQAEGWGWPGINPTGISSLKTTYTKGQLAIKEACGDIKSGCKRTCEEAVADVLYNFPHLEIVLLENGVVGVAVVQVVEVVHNMLLDLFCIQLSLEEDLAYTTTKYKDCAQTPCLNQNFIEGGSPAITPGMTIGIYLPRIGRWLCSESNGRIGHRTWRYSWEAFQSSSTSRWTEFNVERSPWWIWDFYLLELQIIMEQYLFVNLLLFSSI